MSIVKRPDSEVQIEGDDTPPVRVIAHDVFPPSVPAGLQAAYSGEGQKPFIDLIWAPVTNADLAGYNVYRSETDGAAIKLNSELVNRRRIAIARSPPAKPIPTQFPPWTSVETKASAPSKPASPCRKRLCGGGRLCEHCP